MFIRELHIKTGRLEDTHFFYADVLGFEVLRKNEQSITFKTGATRLVFQQSDQHEPTTYHLAFNIPSNQIIEALNWISSKTEVLDVAPNEKIADFSNWNAKAFYFLDNNSNILEFIARFDLQHDSYKAFDANSILSISEIGLVTSDVIKTCQTLKEKFNLDLFTKQSPTSHFAVVGDDQGLFIVVTEKRPWFPTQIPSSKSPLKIVFEVDGAKHVLDLYT